MVSITNTDGLQFLSTLNNNTVDLVLTDPPYIISRDSGMDTHYNMIKDNERDGVTSMKTEEEWLVFKQTNPLASDKNHDNFIKHGSIYGKKYGVKTQYGNWDSEFTLEKLDTFIAEYYKKLRKGGTLIMFFDLWKITPLKELFEKHKFKQIRMIEWIKTNPQPLNSSVNYLTNCREIALVGVKGGKPTFNSKYDNGIYSYPIQGGKNKFHPTQKNAIMFEELITKHSNVGDLVVDTFLGGGTTAIACQKTQRRFQGCEVNAEYCTKINKIINDAVAFKTWQQANPPLQDTSIDATFDEAQKTFDEAQKTFDEAQKTKKMLLKRLNTIQVKNFKKNDFPHN